MEKAGQESVPNEERSVESASQRMGGPDLVEYFTKAQAKSSLRFLGVDSLKITTQGIFLMNCMLKWSLSTGRKPTPLAVAVLAFVAEANGASIKLGDLAKDSDAVESTCKLRLKELKAKLVEAAKEIMPWEKDVTDKNVAQHAGTLLGLMEKTSMEKRKRGAGDEVGSQTDLWTGTSEMCGKLSIKEVCEVDVGFDTLPPAYTKKSR